jgi:hypothetical protein
MHSKFVTMLLLPLFAVFSFGLACGGGGSSSPKKAATKTIKGKLTGLKGPTTVGAKTSDGKALKAVIDPKTKEFAINLPKGKSAVMSVKSGTEVKKVSFARDKNGGAKQDNFTYDIPDVPFQKDADLGTLDFGEAGEDIVIGDEADETSVWDYVDSDDDGIMDFDDGDDDGDSTEDFSDADWASEDDWVDTAMDQDSDWDFYEADDMCDMSGTAECMPEDGEFFSADDCDSAAGAEYCYFEGDDGFYTDDDSSWMPDDIDLPDDTNPPDDTNGGHGTNPPDTNCLTACDKECADDEMCLSDCVAKCYQ